MAHNINFNQKTNKHSFMSVAVPAWHGLGQVLSKPANAEEALIQAGLNFEVEKKPLLAKVGKQQIIVPNKYANVRTDTNQVLGVVGKSYTIFQNEQAFSFFDPIIDRSEAIYHTAGALGNGERVWILAKLPSYIKVGKDDLIEQYVLLYLSHDGTTGITAAFTPVRVVCANTLNFAIKGLVDKITVMHTSNAEARLKQGHKILGMSNLLSKELDGIFNQMASKKMTSHQFDNYLQTLFPKRNNVDKEDEEEEDEKRTLFDRHKDEIEEFLEVGIGQQTTTTKGTVFGAYNAIMGWMDHVKYKNPKDEKKLRSLWFGGGEGFKEKAFLEALKYTN
jgi:phage/plasmid-like protein (TIGR03299 family)